MNQHVPSGNQGFAARRCGYALGVTQFEQENDLGRGGGEVDDETLDDAWRNREQRLGRNDDPAEDAPAVDEDAERRS